MPTFLRAVGVHLVAGFTLVGVGWAVWLAAGRPEADPPRDGAARAVAPAVGFFYFAGVAALMLPTSFRRGCLVALIHVLLCLAVLTPTALALHAAGLTSGPWYAPEPSRVVAGSGSGFPV